MNLIKSTLIIIVILIINGCATGSKWGLDSYKHYGTYYTNNMVIYDELKFISLDDDWMDQYKFHPIDNQKIMGTFQGETTEIKFVFEKSFEYGWENKRRRNLKDIKFVKSNKSLKDIVEPEILDRDEWNYNNVVPLYFDLDNSKILFLRGVDMIDILQLDYEKGESKILLKDQNASTGGGYGDEYDYFYSTLYPHGLLKIENVYEKGNLKLINLQSNEVIKVINGTVTPQSFYYTHDKYHTLIVSSKDSYEYYKYDKTGLSKIGSIKKSNENEVFFDIIGRVLKGYKFEISDVRIALVDQYGTLYIFRMDKNGILERKFNSLMIKNNTLTEADKNYISPFNYEIISTTLERFDK